MCKIPEDAFPPEEGWEHHEAPLERFYEEIYITTGHCIGANQFDGETRINFYEDATCNQNLIASLNPVLALHLAENIVNLVLLEEDVNLTDEATETLNHIRGLFKSMY